MPEIPAFLADFISHRKSVLKEKTPQEKKQILKGSTVKMESLDTTVDGIIDKKPGTKALEEYFQKRCDELSKEKMK